VYDDGDCNRFETTLEHWRDVWKHIAVPLNYYRNYKPTLKDVWDLMDIHSEECMGDLGLSGMAQAGGCPP